MTFGLGWLWTIFSSFWFWLDRSIYDLIGDLYNILIDISRVSILSQGAIQSVAGRIQILLGVFMLFNVSFSLIMYIVNPDDFTDKSKGVSKLAMNTIISLVMLAIVPYIFNMAFRLQAMILDDNTLARIVFGDGTDDEGKGYQRDILTGGDKIKYEIIMPFFQPNYSIDGLESCTTLKDSDGKFNSTCYKQLKKKVAAENVVNINNYKLGIEQGSFGLTFRLNTINTTTSKDSEEYVFDYKWPLTTVCGVIVCLLLVSFCIDIGVRSIKLAFLQLIAPIPIISYMDPKSGKDGLFSKWAKMCGTTYISLFVRLLVLFLGIFIITNIDELVDVVDGSTETNPVIKIFIIIGVLFFIKQLPQILNNLGIKLDGDGKFTLNPFKKMEEGMAGYGAIKKATIGAGVAGLAGAAALGANTLTSAQRIKDAKGFKNKAKQIARMPFSMLTGTTSASYRGLKGGLKGGKFGETYASSYGKAMENKQSRSDRVSDGVGWGEMLGSKFRQNVGMHTGGEKVTSATEAAQKIEKTYESMMNAAKGNDTTSFTGTINGATQTFNGIKGLDKFVQELKKTSIKRENYANEQDYLNAVASHQKSIDEAEDLMKTRLNDIASGRIKSSDDAVTSAVQSGYKQMQDIAKDLNDITAGIDKNISQIKDGADAKTIYGTAKGIGNQIISSDQATHQQTVDKYASNKEQK
jgi:hypothetical protein